MSKELKYDQESFRDGLTDNYSWFAKDKEIKFGQSINLNDSLKINAKRARVFINLSNYSRSSLWTEPIPTLNESTNNHKRLGELLAGNSSWLVNKKDILVGQLKDGNFTGHNEIFVHIRDASAQRLNTTSETSWSENSGSSSTVVVLPGESIQAAIDAATSGDTIEVRSGTYRENIYIDKQLSILGVDVGGGLPVVDAGDYGNAIEISAENVSVEGIFATNSSKSTMSELGAGIRVSSNNCSIKDVRTYNNYYGIHLADANNNILSKINSSDNNCGFRLYFSNNNTLQDNNIENCLYGVRLHSSNNNIIIHNNFNGSANPIDKSSSNGNLIENNSIDNDTKNVEETLTFDLPEVEDNAVDAAPLAPINKVSGKGSDNGDDGLEIEPYQTNHPTYTEEIQKCIDEEIERLPWGQVAFTPSEKMSKGVPCPVKARICRNLFENITKGLEKFEKVETEQIKVSYEMNVKLDGGDDFKISPEIQEPKILPKLGFAEWTWEVTPLESGTHILELTALATINLPKGEKRIDETVFEKEIFVSVDSLREIKIFFLGGGKWVIGLFVTTLVAGLIAILSGGIIDRIKSLKKK